MSTKALKKELLVAVVMLLVAAVALSGSTYAWYAQNTRVTAAEVEVTAQTAKNLSISNTENGTYATSAPLQVTSGGAMWPVTATNKVNDTTYNSIGTQATFNLTSSGSAAFFIIDSDNKVTSGDLYDATTAAAVALATGVTGTDTNDGAFTTSGAAGNFWTEDVWLRYDYTEGQSTAIDGTVTVSLNTTATAITTDAAIVDAYHVALVCDAANNGTYVWKMGQIADGDRNKDGSDNVNNNAENGNNLEATITFENLFTVLPANAPRLVRLYIWYEGEDPDCYSTASLQPTLLTTNFAFEIHQ